MLCVMKHKPPLKPDMFQGFCFSSSSLKAQLASYLNTFQWNKYDYCPPFIPWPGVTEFCRCSIHRRLISESLTLESSPSTAEKIAFLLVRGPFFPVLVKTGKAPYSTGSRFFSAATWKTENGPVVPHKTRWWRFCKPSLLFPLVQTGICWKRWG